MNNKSTAKNEIPVISAETLPSVTFSILVEGRIF